MSRLLPFLLLLLLLLLLVASSTRANDIQGFWSLDCGGEGFEDNNITWVSDKAFVRSGVIREGKNGSLRVFTSKEMKKSCYTIPVGKGVKILVRLYFSYGNYDGLGSPPEMELIFDGYDWVTLQTTMEGGDWVEEIYVTKRTNTNICFGRTASNSDPFVSLIRVTTLELNMYNAVDEGKVLWLQKRNAFGADAVIQYPDDPYDRWWFPRSKGFTVLRSDTTYANKTSWPTDDHPPPLLIQTAVGPLNMTSSKLSISLSDLPKDPISIYYNIYFSEVSNKTTYGSRAFNFFIDGDKMSTTPIIPPYQSLDEYYSSGIKASNSTTFEFVSTRNATLPPIITAMEIFEIEDIGGVTFENDVVALGNLQERFEILQEWTGDPCLPEKYNWEWVGCQVFNNPRVSKLDLSGFGLSGKLPDFTDLDHLVVIDLHNNSLSGPIPEFFNNFQNLTLLNLANNKFTSIPDSLLYNKKIKLNISGNPIRLPPPTPGNGNGNEGQKAKVPDQLLLCLLTLLLPLILF